MEFSEEQLSKSTKIIEEIEFNELPGLENYERPEFVPKINLWTVQRRDLRRNPTIFEDNPGIYAEDATLAGKISKTASSVILKWATINEQAAIKGLERIFRPTNKIVEHTQTLTFVIPEDEKTFGEVLDALYMMLYEGAGAGNLKFINEFKLMTIDDADALMCIKFFRNHLRHDPEHGSDGEIRKKFKTVAEYLSMFGFQALPSTVTEIGELHYRILAYVDNFLDELYSRVSAYKAGN